MKIGGFPSDRGGTQSCKHSRTVRPEGELRRRPNKSLKSFNCQDTGAIPRHTVIEYTLYILHRPEELKREGLLYAQYLDPQSLPYIEVPRKLEKNIATAKSRALERTRLTAGYVGSFNLVLSSQVRREN